MGFFSRSVSSGPSLLGMQMKRYRNAARGAVNQRVARAALVAHKIGSSMSLAGEAARHGVSSFRNPLSAAFRSQHARNYAVLSGTPNLANRINQRAGIRYTRPDTMSDFVNTHATQIDNLRQEIVTLKSELASKMNELQVMEVAQRAAKLQHNKNLVKHRRNSILANRSDSRRATAVNEQLAMLNRANKAKNALNEIRKLKQVLTPS